MSIQLKAHRASPRKREIPSENWRESARKLLEPIIMIALLGVVYIQLNSNGLPLELSGKLVWAGVFLILHRAGIDKSILTSIWKVKSGSK